MNTYKSGTLWAMFSGQCSLHVLYHTIKDWADNRIVAYPFRGLSVSFPLFNELEDWMWEFRYEV